MASKKVEDLGDYEFIRYKDKLLGAGGFGKVWSGKRKTETEDSTDRNVAIKEIAINVHTSKFIDREQTLMRKLKRTPHDNVIRFIDSVMTNFYVYFIIELCTLVDLNRFMKTQTENTFSLCSKVMHCTSAGLRHLHKKIKVCHRDIKPANVLVTGTSSDFHMKIADLGLARPIDDTSSTRFHTGRVGTWGWMAPEMPVTPNASHQYSYPADVFSLGLLFESVFRYQPGRRSHLEYHEEEGTYLAAWLRTVDSLGQRVQELDLQFHGGRFVTQAMKLIQKLICFSTSERFNIDQVCTEIQNIQDDINKGPVTSDDTAIHVKKRAEPRSHVIVSKNKRAIDDEPVTSDDARDVQEQAEASTSKTVNRRKDCIIELRKLGHITLPVSGKVHLVFGQANLLVGFEHSPDFFYYGYQSDQLKLLWHKNIPKGVKFDCLKHISPRGVFFLQSRSEVCLYDQELRLISKLTSPGKMISLLPGGERAVVSNHHSSSSRTEGLRLAVTSVSNLYDTHHQLDVPPVKYTREDKVRVCGLEDGRLAVVILKKRYCDVYDGSGRHIERTSLPAGAGEPSCTSEYILVPLWKKPAIPRLYPKLCVLDWAGHVIRILEHTELGLEKDDWCPSVSPVNNGLVSFWLDSASSGKWLINTYQVTVTPNTLWSTQSTMVGV